MPPHTAQDVIIQIDSGSVKLGQITMTIQQYLLSLPLVRTATLAKGVLFWAPSAIYEIITDDAADFRRARQWQGDERTDVAVVPGSALAMQLPLVQEGRLLPVYANRETLLQDGELLSFVFPQERTGLDIAKLDARLCGNNAGLYVRRYERYPAFEVTNGLNSYRRYYYARTNQGLNTDLTAVKQRLGVSLVPHLRGPWVWRLLPSWDESPYDDQPTIMMRSADLLGRVESATTQHNLRAYTPPDEEDEGEK